jgi:hypothetical protein
MLCQLSYHTPKGGTGLEPATPGLEGTKACTPGTHLKLWLPEN